MQADSKKGCRATSLYRKTGEVYAKEMGKMPKVLARRGRGNLEKKTGDERG